MSIMENKFAQTRKGSKGLEFEAAEDVLEEENQRKIEATVCMNYTKIYLRVQHLVRNRSISVL